MTPPDFNRSLSHRLRNRAEELGVDPGRLRRHLVFQRILARLAKGDIWVLKGGFSLEVQLQLRGRATKDLDMVVSETPNSALDLQDLLDEILETNSEDRFTFEVGLPKPLPARDLGAPGWRLKVRALYTNALFETVTLDVVSAADEVGGGLQEIVIEPIISTDEFAPTTMTAVDIPQHAAEKIHAYCRIYSGEQPSSRVKDLIDLVLLIEAGLLDPTEWAERCRHVFDVRADTPLPEKLEAPPASWAQPYLQTAAELDLTAADLDSAFSLVEALYTTAFAIPASQKATNGHAQ